MHKVRERVAVDVVQGTQHQLQYTGVHNVVVFFLYAGT